MNQSQRHSAQYAINEPVTAAPCTVHTQLMNQSQRHRAPCTVHTQLMNHKNAQLPNNTVLILATLLSRVRGAPAEVYSPAKKTNKTQSVPVNNYTLLQWPDETS